MNTNWLDYTLLTLVIIGAINWGLIGFFRFDLVAFIFGNMSWFSRIIYALVGLGGLYLISLFRAHPLCRSGIRSPWPAKKKCCIATALFLRHFTFYKEMTIFALAQSGRDASFLETLKTNFTLYFSLMISSF